MEMLDTRNCVCKETANSVNVLIQLKEKMKKYKLEETATNEFDEQIFKIMNDNFRKYEMMIIKLVRSGHVKFK